MKKLTVELVKKQKNKIFSKQTFIQRPGDSKGKRASLIRGDGIGEEIIGSVQNIFEALNVPIEFDKIKSFRSDDKEKVKLIKQNDSILMGPVKKYKGYNSDQTQLYKNLGVYAQVTPIQSIPGLGGARHKGVDTVIIRENTEGEYSGIEHEVYPGVIESIKVTTMDASLKVADYAFEFAYLSGRKKVTAVHKANIMKICDGLFLEACREIAQKYPQINYEEMIVDNTSMQLVKTPQQFDVMVMPNLYGTIIQNIATGVTGTIGMIPGVCVGKNYSIYGQGVRHRAYDIAGQNLANPTGMILSSICMLRHQNLPVFADAILQGLVQTIQDKQVITKDMGGSSTTSQFTSEIIKNSLNKF